MALVEKLKEYNSSMYISTLNDDLQNEVKEYTLNFCQKSFVTEDETEQAVNDALNSRISDILYIMEEE